MNQYLELLKTIKEKGTYKPAAREGMPGTQSLFGYQFRHNLADGFPLLTTKKMFFKGVVIELLWFLRGDTNIKYLVDNGVNIWNEDAYHYYLKQCKINKQTAPMGFDQFVDNIKTQAPSSMSWFGDKTYDLGDCGYQYGKVWRKWLAVDQKQLVYDETKSPFEFGDDYIQIDQIKNLIEGLRKSPESRRHIVTAWDPAHDQDLALTWCHAMFQFNCRPLTADEKWELFEPYREEVEENEHVFIGDNLNNNWFDNSGIPKYYLDCQLYQRSADVVLGVPFNIASYALLTEIIAKMCNMIPGEFIHTFGDVHIYDNHKDAVEEQLKRTPTELPKLKLSDMFLQSASIYEDLKFDSLIMVDFGLDNYNPQSKIDAELSTGLKK